MTHKLLLLVCDSLSWEAEKAFVGEPYEDVLFATYPARCGRPPVSWSEISAIAHSHVGVDSVVIYGGCCVSSLADAKVDGISYQVHHLDQCFDMIADHHVIDRYCREGGYLVTPGWLTEWRTHITLMGFDRETARDFYKETTTVIMLLDTETDAASAQNLLDFAEFVDQPYRVIPTGISHFRLLLIKTILTWRLESERQATSTVIHSIQKQSADHAMAIDLLGLLAQNTDEDKAIAGILEIFSMLFAPQRIAYLSFQRKKPDALHLRQSMSKTDARLLKERLAHFHEDSAWTEDGYGFLLRIRYQGETQGVIAVEAIAFPEYREHYLNLAQGIVIVCALAIDNARKYQRIREKEAALEELNDQMHQQAITDALTNLANRRYFDQVLAQEWKRMTREKLPLSLIMCDIDFFKKYNDRYGHQAGDACLSAVARSINEQVARPGDLVARYGGEEFVVILPNTTSEGTMLLAEKIRNAVSMLQIPHDDSPVNACITLSLGIAEILPTATHTPDSLLHAADMALYAAKKQGRNRCCTMVENMATTLG